MINIDNFLIAFDYIYSSLHNVQCAVHIIVSTTQEVPDLQLVSGDGGSVMVSMPGLAAVSPWVARWQH
jgi:hypothetical protein